MLNRSTGSGGDEAWRIEGENRDAALSLVTVMWRVGQLRRARKGGELGSNQINRRVRSVADVEQSPLNATPT